MTASELRKKYLEFFESKGHKIVPSASLIPENDPTTLFISAGMQSLVPYLLGEKHPAGNKIANIQKCIRTQDIDEVGDNRHLTFFEMMGNWSLGSYFKEDAIKWSWEFLIDSKWLGLDPKRIYVTVFKGEDGIPRDEKAIEIWKEVFKKAGIEAAVAEEENMDDNVRIIPLGKKDNFWIAGEAGLCGEDTEIYYDVAPEIGKMQGGFSEIVDSFRLIEIWNNVFMQYDKTVDGKYKILSQENVDTGMGLERTLMILNKQANVFETELFSPIFVRISEISGVDYFHSLLEFRIIADHIKASVFIISEGITPSNVGAGYILRRLIRRSIRKGKILGIEKNFIKDIAEKVVEVYEKAYPEIKTKNKIIFKELEKEENKFRETLDNGLKEFEKYFAMRPRPTKIGSFKTSKEATANRLNKIAFYLFQTFGFPLEMTIEEAKNRNLLIDEKLMAETFNKDFTEHQEKSRTASAGMFKGGLADASEDTKKYHTVAHLMLAGLRKVLGEHIVQKGSNITAERLRFDFSHNEKMTDEQKKAVEDFVNGTIQKKIPVVCEEMSLEEAKKQNAMGIFENKYGEKVKVYTIGEISKEICGGPHIKNTGDIQGTFKIKKEESSSAGVRRIKAVVE